MQGLLQAGCTAIWFACPAEGPYHAEQVVGVRWSPVVVSTPVARLLVMYLLMCILIIIFTLIASIAYILAS